MTLKSETKPRNFSRFSAWTYRIPLPVRKVLLLVNGDSYPICPRCDRALDREYMNFCDNCGQRLEWSYFDFASVVHTPRR